MIDVAYAHMRRSGFNLREEAEAEERMSEEEIEAQSADGIRNLMAMMSQGHGG